MMRKLLLAVVLLVLLSAISMGSQQKSILVLGQGHFNKGISEGELWVDIAVDSDGTWREATLKDVWEGQKFSIIAYREQPLSKEITISRVGDNLPAIFSTPVKWNNYNKELVLFKTKAFVHKTIGSAFKHSIVDMATQRELEKQHTDVKILLEKVIETDWPNLKKEFPKLKAYKILYYLVGDVNGDKKEDYALIIGDSYGSPESSPALLLMYVSGATQYKKIILGFWENVEYTYPVLIMTHDFNGDNADELYVANIDSEEAFPVIYTWTKDGLAKVYEGKTPLWQ